MLYHAIDKTDDGTEKKIEFHDGSIMKFPEGCRNTRNTHFLNTINTTYVFVCFSITINKTYHSVLKRSTSHEDIIGSYYSPTCMYGSYKCISFLRNIQFVYVIYIRI